MAPFLEKMKHGLVILGLSFKTIWDDKRYLLFPLITTFFVITFVAIIIYISNKTGFYWWQKDFLKTEPKSHLLILIPVFFILELMRELFATIMATTIAHYTLQ